MTSDNVVLCVLCACTLQMTARVESMDPTLALYILISLILHTFPPLEQPSMQ